MSILPLKCEGRGHFPLASSVRSTPDQPELVLEDDINQLLATREAIATYVLAEVAEEVPTEP